MTTPMILSLDVAGAPRAWMTLEEAIVRHAKGLVAWELGEDQYLFRGGMSRMTGERTTLTTKTIIAVRGEDVGKIEGKRIRAEPQIDNDVLFGRDRHLCAYCGNHFKTKLGILTRDHILPQFMGGKDKWMNLVTSCRPCNHRKNNRTPEGARMPLLYLPYVPNKHEWMILSNRKILADQMDFLMHGVPANSRIHEKH